VLEIVRQLCILINDANKWWNYVVKYGQWCLINGATDQCQDEAIKIAGLDRNKIEKCIKDSFVGEDRELNDNTLLAKEY